MKCVERSFRHPECRDGVHGWKIHGYIVSPELSQSHSTSVIGSFLTNITQLSPAGVVEGTEAQIKVIGSNFRPSHQVLLNGKKIHSRFVNGRELEIQIPATNPGTHKITVIDPGVAASELNAGYLVVGYR